MKSHTTHGGFRTASDGDADDMMKRGGEMHEKRADGGRAEEDHEKEKRGGHMRRASGGKAETDGEPAGDNDKGEIQVYNAQGSKVMKNAEDETPDFRRGGRTKKKDGGKAEGEMERQRMDRRPRRAAGGRAGHSPYSSASAFADPTNNEASRGFEGTPSKRGT